MKLIFAVLYVSLNDGPLHFVIKRKFFTFIFAVFQSQSIAEILLVLLPHLVNKQMPYGNSTFGCDFELFIVIIGMWFCTNVTNFIRIGRSMTELWRYVDFPRWRPYCRKSTFVLWFYNVSHFGRQRTICIPNFNQISQSTAEILLLPVAKKTSAILKFYTRFRFWPFYCYRHVILQWPTKLYANWMIADGLMTSYWFYKMAAIASEIYFRFPGQRVSFMNV